MDFLAEISSMGLLVLAFALLLVGLVGSFLPILPGPPIAWGGVLAAFFCGRFTISTLTLAVTAAVTVAVTVADYVLPPMFTKKGGGTKMGSLGATVGLVVGIFIPIPILALIFCPFFGAFLFEMLADPGDTKKAFDSAWGAFKGFLAGTGVKAIVCVAFAWILVLNLLKGWF